MSHSLVSNHVPKKQMNDNKKNIKMLRSKNRGYPNSHIVNQTITMTNKVFMQSNWLEVHIDCIEVHYVEACKRAYTKAVGRWVLQIPWLPQQLHVGDKVVDDCQPSKCTLAWRKRINIGLCKPKCTKFHHVARKFFSAIADDGQMPEKLQIGGALLIGEVHAIPTLLDVPPTQDPTAILKPYRELHGRPWSSSDLKGDFTKEFLNQLQLDILVGLCYHTFNKDELQPKKKKRKSCLKQTGLKEETKTFTNYNAGRQPVLRVAITSHFGQTMSNFSSIPCGHAYQIDPTTHPGILIFSPYICYTKVAHILDLFTL